MRRIICLVLAAALLLLAVACKDKGKKEKQSGGSSSDIVDSSEPIKDGWVNSIIPDSGGSEESSENESSSEKGSSSEISSVVGGSEGQSSFESSSNQNTSSSHSSSDQNTSSDPDTSSRPSWGGNNSSSNVSSSRPTSSSNVSSNKPTSSSKPSSNPVSSSGNTSSGNTSSGGSTAPSGTVWDGSVASGFSAGNGSSSSPYIIRSGSELARLASDVNRGISYAGKVFMLGADIDLGNREWTPIGNGKYAFEGVFIGCDKTVKNISISKQTTYIRSSDRVDFGYAGLFGYVKNAEIDSLVLDGIKIKLEPSLSCDYTRIGGLVAEVYASSESTITNVRVKNMKVETTFSSTYLTVGGIVGYVGVGESASFSADCVEAETTIKDKENDYVSYLGGIFGYLSNRGSGSVSNFASYSTAYWSDTDDGDNYAGAIAALNNHKGTVKLSNAFSSLKINRKYNVSSSPISRAGAVIGTYYTDKDVKETNIHKNLFGYVASVYNHYDPALVLYGSYINDDSLTSANCTGCMSLPEGHGFKSSVWLLTDLSHPILK